MATQDNGRCNANILVELSTPSEAEVDIIVVHGMNVQGNATHAENTWTDDKTGVNWLRTLLPTKLPRARILAFQYNANVLFTRSLAGFEEQATNLLENLKIKRKVNPTRPIIFIAHSLGGIVVKETLSTAFYYREAHPMTWSYVHSIFFLGVPHNGADNAAWLNIVSNIIAATSTELTNSILEGVLRDSDFNAKLNTRFKPLHRAYRFYSWVETLPTELLGTPCCKFMIVPQDSATLGLEPEWEVVRSANRDHRSICKFSGESDSEWIQLSESITEAVTMATTSFNYSTDLASRIPLFEAQPSQPRSLVLASNLNDVEKKTRSVLQEFDAFRESELPEIRGEIESERSMLWTLAGGLLGLLAATGFLDTRNLAAWIVQGLISAAAWVLMPSQATVMENVDQGITAEDKIIETETRIIAGLDRYQVRILQAAQSVHTIPLHISVVHVDAEMHDRLKDLHMRLMEAAKRNEKETYFAIKSRERARLEKIQIEEGRAMVAGKEGPELMRGLVAAYEHAQASQASTTEAEANERESSTCPYCLVM